jgi:rhodanese-related sulfurtransferase
MTLVDTNKAVEFFRAKCEFTTGPLELKHLMDTEENINTIDVRKEKDYAAGHIPGAINLPREKWDSFGGLRHDKVNIVYCYSQVCHLAAEAALVFAERGYSVMELEGGFDEWKKHKLPVES